MTDWLLLSFWCLLPAGVANATPVIVAKVPKLKLIDYPLDCYLELQGKRLFGTNKTWRGLLSGVLVAGFIAWLLHYFMVWPKTLINTNPFLFGSTLGFGALAGDAIASLLKRQLGANPGQTVLVLDQVDYIIGSLLTLQFFITITWQLVISSLLLWVGAHIVVGWLGFHLGLKQKPI